MRQELEYDFSGRVKRVRALRSLAVESDVTFTYSNGRPSVASDPTNGLNESYTYDSYGRLSCVTYSQGESVLLGYDILSRVTTQEFRLPGGTHLATLTRTFGPSGREHKLSYEGTVLRDRSFCSGFSCASLVQTSYGNGTVRKNFRSNGFPVGRELWRGSTRLEKSDYTVSSNLQAILSSQVTTVTNSGATFNFSTTESYQYESSATIAGSDRRLKSGPSSLSSSATGTFAFDHLSNILREQNSATTRAFSYNAEHTRLLSSSGPNAASYAYDEAGFETSRTIAGQTTVSAWSARGKIASLTTGGVVVASFQYDSLGRRRQFTVNGTTRRWLFGGSVEATLADAPVAIDNGEIRIQFNGQHKYRHFDIRGNTKLRTNAAGQIESHYRFDSYGLKNSVGVLDNDFLFAGGMRVVAGVNVFTLLGPRLLDSATGRFTSVDPVWNPLSRCSYAKGNPVDYRDSNGMSECQGSFTDVQEADMQMEIVTLELGQDMIVGFASGAGILAGIFGTPIAGLGVAGVASLPAAPLYGLRRWRQYQLAREAQTEARCERDRQRRNSSAAATAAIAGAIPTTELPSIGITVSLPLGAFPVPPIPLVAPYYGKPTVTIGPEILPPSGPPSTGLHSF